MNKFLVPWLFCLLVICCATPVMASGFFDEYFLTSKWWAKDGQYGNIEFNVLGAEASTGSINLLCHQTLGPRAVLAINGLFGADLGVGAGLFNATIKSGTPNLYVGAGGIMALNDDALIALPRFNMGGKFGPDFFKVVLDADFYTLIWVNAGKLEAGIEVIPFPVLRLYGGVYKLFVHKVIKVETVPGNVFHLQAKLETKPVFVSGEVNFFDSTSKPVIIGEAGVNIYSFSLVGKVVYPGVYSFGLRLNY